MPPHAADEGDLDWEGQRERGPAPGPALEGTAELVSKKPGKLQAQPAVLVAGCMMLEPDSVVKHRDGNRTPVVAVGMNADRPAPAGWEGVVQSV